MFGWFKKKQRKQKREEIISNFEKKIKEKYYPETNKKVGGYDFTAPGSYDYMAREKWEDISYPHRREENSLLDPVVPAVVLAAMISENNQESVSTPADAAGVECVEDRDSNVSVCEDRNTVSSYDPSPSYDSSSSYSDSGSSYSDSGGSYSSGD